MSRHPQGGFRLLAIGAWCSLLAASPLLGSGPSEVGFNRDVHPVLADKCFPCHGPDERQRQADLRLDHEPTEAIAREIARRVSSTDVDERMPPANSDKALSVREIQQLTAWVAQGAKWQTHWSYLPAERPVGLAESGPPGENPIDGFVSRRLAEAGLAPAPPADRRTLARRLSLDLLGLPPAWAEVERFVSDEAPGAYAALVDRTLASPHFGERMAVFWLDLVRYGDTNGIHSDVHRDHAAYRDWVIDAFNANMPFDQFTIEQLAGDLLPDATDQQRIASGYNRLNLTTEEGGAQPKEYLAKYAADRVRNFGSVWLASTIGCAECHDHKYDPFTMQHFYGLEAFFADVVETAVGVQQPERIPTPEQAHHRAQLDKELSRLRAELESQSPQPDARHEPDSRREALRERIAGLERERIELEKQFPPILVTVSGPPREIRVLPRGNWLDESGPVVTPSVPEFLAPLAVSGRRGTRLDLANWAVEHRNPLVARVLVNRLWKLCFGQGLVRSVDDFGSQGTWPQHQELLDWLASELVDSGWDVKQMLQLIVTSETYRQSSVASDQAREHDPLNQYWSRQERFRLGAEFVRDAALATSGLLVTKFGGRSVKPYQPEGYWQYLNFPKRTWQHDLGEDQYRRGVYTYWCRTFPHPALAALDAPPREECTAERPRSNTPLQSLVLLNDPSFVEAARTLAARARSLGLQSQSQSEDRVHDASDPAFRGDSETGHVGRHLFRIVLGRDATDEELGVLLAVYAKHKAHYESRPGEAVRVSRVGDSPAAAGVAPADLAAWTSVARVVLNMHEALTRP